MGQGEIIKKVSEKFYAELAVVLSMEDEDIKRFYDENIEFITPNIYACIVNTLRDSKIKKEYIEDIANKDTKSMFSLLVGWSTNEDCNLETAINQFIICLFEILEGIEKKEEKISCLILIVGSIVPNIINTVGEKEFNENNMDEYQMYLTNSLLPLTNKNIKRIQNAVYKKVDEETKITMIGALKDDYKKLKLINREDISFEKKLLLFRSVDNKEVLKDYVKAQRKELSEVTLGEADANMIIACFNMLIPTLEKIKDDDLTESMIEEFTYYGPEITAGLINVIDDDDKKIKLLEKHIKELNNSILPYCIISTIKDPEKYRQAFGKFSQYLTQDEESALAIIHKDSELAKILIDEYYNQISKTTKAEENLDISRKIAVLLEILDKENQDKEFDRFIPIFARNNLHAYALSKIKNRSKKLEFLRRLKQETPPEVQQSENMVPAYMHVDDLSSIYGIDIDVEAGISNVTEHTNRRKAYDALSKGIEKDRMQGFVEMISTMEEEDIIEFLQNFAEDIDISIFSSLVAKMEHPEDKLDYIENICNLPPKELLNSVLLEWSIAKRIPLEVATSEFMSDILKMFISMTPEFGEEIIQYKKELLFKIFETTIPTIKEIIGKENYNKSVLSNNWPLLGKIIFTLSKEELVELLDICDDKNDILCLFDNLKPLAEKQELLKDDNYPELNKKIILKSLNDKEVLKDYLAYQENKLNTETNNESVEMTIYEILVKLKDDNLIEQFIEKYKDNETHILVNLITLINDDTKKVELLEKYSTKIKDCPNSHFNIIKSLKDFAQYTKCYGKYNSYLSYDNKASLAALKKDKELSTVLLNDIYENQQKKFTKAEIINVAKLLEAQDKDSRYSEISKLNTFIKDEYEAYLMKTTDDFSMKRAIIAEYIDITNTAENKARLDTFSFEDSIEKNKINYFANLTKTTKDSKKILSFIEENKDNLSSDVITGLMTEVTDSKAIEKYIEYFGKHVYDIINNWEKDQPIDFRETPEEQINKMLNNLKDILSNIDDQEILKKSLIIVLNEIVIKLFFFVGEEEFNNDCERPLLNLISQTFRKLSDKDKNEILENIDLEHYSPQEKAFMYALYDSDTVRKEQLDREDISEEIRDILGEGMKDKEFLHTYIDKKIKELLLAKTNNDIEKEEQVQNFIIGAAETLSDEEKLQVFDNILSNGLIIYDLLLAIESDELKVKMLDNYKRIIDRHPEIYAVIISTIKDKKLFKETYSKYEEGFVEDFLGFEYGEKFSIATAAKNKEIAKELLKIKYSQIANERLDYETGVHNAVIGEVSFLLSIFSEEEQQAIIKEFEPHLTLLDKDNIALATKNLEYKEEHMKEIEKQVEKNIKEYVKNGKKLH